MLPRLPLVALGFLLVAMVTVHSQEEDGKSEEQFSSVNERTNEEGNGAGMNEEDVTRWKDPRLWEKSERRVVFGSEGRGRRTNGLGRSRYLVLRMVNEYLES